MGSEVAPESTFPQCRVRCGRASARAGSRQIALYTRTQSVGAPLLFGIVPAY